MDTDNSTTGPGAGRDAHLAKAEVATLAAMFVAAVGGNCVTLRAILVRRGRANGHGHGHGKLTRMRYLIVHLCLADLLVAAFHIFPQLLLDATERFVGGYPGDDALCRLVKFLQVLGPYLSAYVLVAAAVDRYLAIRFPLKARCCKVLVGAAWALALLCSVPQVLVFSYRLRPGTALVYDCWATFSPRWGERAYVTFFACAVFVVPFCVLLFTYVGICRAIWVNLRRKRSSAAATTNNNGNPRTHSVRGISRAKMKTVKMTVVVMLCHVTCSMPYISSMLWLAWYPAARQTPFGQSAAFAILALLASLNSCANPWIYLCFNENVARTLRDVIGCRDDDDDDSSANGAPAPGVFSRSSLSDTAQRSNQLHTVVHWHG